MKTWLAIIGCLFTLIGCDSAAVAEQDKSGDVTDTADNTFDGDTGTDEAVTPDTGDDTDEVVDLDTGDTDTDEAVTPDSGDEPDETVDPDTGDTDTDETVTPDSDTGGAPSDLGAMISIPAGEFQMGCNEEVEVQCSTGFDVPYHTVTLSAYKIDKYEVTVGEYQKCIKAGACNNNGDYVHYNNSVYCNLSFEDMGIESHPMNCVSWYGAKAYCEWVGKRLPTEAEWEKAARGADGRKFPWGNEPAASCDYVVMAPYNEHTGEYDYGCGYTFNSVRYNTMPVGSKPLGKSLYGAYDMLGNVGEWTSDWFASDYYASSPTNDPTGPESGTERTVRGGSFNSRDQTPSDIRMLSVNFRYRGGTPIYSEDFTLGFRCAK